MTPLTASSGLYAADVYWNNTSGTWDTATATWNTASDGSGSTQVWFDGDNAVFSAGTSLTGQYSLSNNGVTLGNITQEEGRIRIQNNTLTLGSTSATFDIQTRVSGDYDVRIDSVIADSSGGASAITKSGSGILMLTGANTFSGGLTLNSGTIAVESTASALGTGTLTLNGGNLVKSWGTGSTLTLASNINATGTTNIGVVQASKGNFAFTGTVTGSGTIQINNTAVNGLSVFASTIFFSGDLSGYTGSFEQTSGNNRLRFGTTNSGSANIDLSQGKLVTHGSTSSGNPVDLADGAYGTMKIGELSGDGGILRAGWSADGNTTFEVGALNTDSTYAGSIQDNPNGSGGLTALNKVGTGTLTLTGPNTYTSDTTVNEGTLALGANDVVEDTSNIVMNGGTLSAGGNDTVGTLNVTADSTFDFVDGCALVFEDSSSNSWSGTLGISGSFVSGSSLRFGSDANGLTADQLNRIIKTGFTFSLDASGYLIAASAVPEPSTCAIWGGLMTLGMVAYRRRRA